MYPSVPVMKTLIAPRSKGGLPRFPGRPAAVPQVFEDLSIPGGIHALPEPLVPVGGQLIAASEMSHRTALPRFIIVLDVIDRAGLNHEESAVDPQVLLERLFLKPDRARSVLGKCEHTERQARMCCGHRHQLPLTSVKFDEPRDIHVRDAVTIRHAEGFVP